MPMSRFGEGDESTPMSDAGAFRKEKELGPVGPVDRQSISYHLPAGS